MSMKQDLLRYIDAGYPIIYINSFEETKTDRIISEAIGGRKALEWNGSGGFADFKSKQVLIPNKTLLQTLQFLSHDCEELNEKILVLKDVHPYLEEREVIAQLKNICQKITADDDNDEDNEFDTTIIIVAPIVKVPRELEMFVTILELEYLKQEEILGLIQDFSQKHNTRISDELAEKMSMAFKGLSEFEVNNLLASALSESDDREIRPSHLKLIFEQKQQMIMKSGILEMIPLKEKPDDIGGLENLKEWLYRKAKVYKSINKAAEFGVDMPKGVLIAGVPGCGKSLTAKVTAQLFEVPLLRLDMGKILGKYVGESEENMRRAIALAEAISPCVLWIDELEKAFAGINGSGSEVTVRLFGTFLTWMQEKSSPAFVIATANDITKLPPELMRKGRFDEIFFVGLPNPSERKKIFEIHIKKRRSRDLNSINIDELVKETEGYSGADIEGVVRDAVENAFADDKNSVTTDYIKHAIKETHSLSEIMKESLDKLSEEYKNRKFKNASV